MSWTASNNPSNFGIQTQSDISNTTSVPSLFSVATGTYATLGTFGSMKPAVLVSTSTNENDSGFVIRKEDKQIDFAVKLILNADGETFPFPGQTTGEVRIKAKDYGLPTPMRRPQSKILTPIDLNIFQPLFDCEILQVNGAPIASAWPPSTGGLGELKARWLFGGQLALVNVNYNVASNIATTPLTVADFNALTVPCVISVRGSYICDSPSQY